MAEVQHVEPRYRDIYENAKEVFLSNQYKKGQLAEMHYKHQLEMARLKHSLGVHDV